MTDPLRTDLNDFLFTSVADDSNGMHLTMLSVLARSGVDPWAEAAGLAALSRENATQKLVALLAGVPNGPSPGDDTATLAERLLVLLHSSPKRRLNPTPVPQPVAADGKEPPPHSFSALPRRIRLAIYSVLALILMVVGYRAMSSSEPELNHETGQQQSR